MFRFHILNLLFRTCDDGCIYCEGFKKQIKKASKNVIKLYSSYPSEVVSILLEFLLKAHESANMPNSLQLDDWKPLIMKLSNKEPDMLLSLLKEVVYMLETTRDDLKYESGI